MRLSAKCKLNSQGIAHHLIVPLLAVVAVGVIGAAYLALSSAATATVNVTLYQGNCAQKYQLLKASAGSANATCVKQTQDLIDIFQYASSPRFAISVGSDPASKAEVFTYSGGTYVTMNGSYNGATQGAVNTIAHISTGSLTNASVSGATVNKGTWETFCEAVASKKTANPGAFTHTSYNFGGGHTINSSGTTIFGSVCGSSKSKSFSTSGTGTSSGSPEGKAFLARAEKWQGLAYVSGGGLMHSSTGYYSAFTKTCEGGVSGGTPKIASQCATDCSGFVSMVVDDVLHTNYVWTAGTSSLANQVGSGVSHWHAVSINSAQPGDIAVGGSGHVEFVMSGTGQNMVTYGEHATGQVVGKGGGYGINQVYRWE